MAAAVSTPATGTFLTSVRPYRRDPEQQSEHGVWRLPPNHIADLKDVTRGVEETDAGICCKYLIDSMSGAGSDFDEVSLEAAENFCEQNEIWNHKIVDGWRTRIKRSRRALALMHHRGQHHHVSVLHVVYGYPDPSTREFPQKVLTNLGELASLVRYTDSVEVRRKEMARCEAVAMSNRKVFITPTKDLPAHWKNANDEIVENDEREQTGDETSRVAIRQGLPVSGAPFLLDVMRHREMYERALRIITSGDAVRMMFAPPSERPYSESDSHFEERKLNVELKRDLFLVEVKIETTLMLEAASKIYHRSWLESAG